MTLPPKPTALEVWHRNTPAALKEVEGWILWKYTLVNGKWTKPPFNEDGKKIDAHDPTEWMTFSQAVQAYQRGGFDGIGLSLNAMEALAGVDLDHCVKGGEIEPWALEIVSELGSYVEISPSGEGLRILGYGKLRREGRKKGNVEVYDGGRYLTFTGHKLDSATSDIEDFDEALDRVHHRIWAETPKIPTAHSKVGGDLAERFAALCDDDPNFKDRFYSPANIGDRSDQEFHLCARLWEEGFSELEIRSLMDSSPQEKWRERGADDYRDTTIRRAIQSAAAPKATASKGVPETGAEAKPIDDDELNSLDLATRPRLENRLEGDHFISQYMAYGSATCDAYPEYHYSGALIQLSVAVARNLVIKLKQERIYPNIWSFNLGPSTISRKSTAMRKMEDLLKVVAPERAIPKSFSPEALVEFLSDHPEAYLVKDEVGQLLTSMQKSYMSDIRDFFCDIFDNGNYDRMLRTGKSKAKTRFEISDPFVVQSYATTNTVFREYTSTLDLTSGWLLRFLFFAPNYKKTSMPFEIETEAETDLYGAVLGRFSALHKLFRESMPGTMGIDDDAMKFYQKWQLATENDLVDEGDELSLSLFGRLQVYALKLAVLFTVGKKGYKIGDKVTMGYMQEACRQIEEYFLPVGRSVAEEVGRAEQNNLQNKIIGTIERNGGKIKRRDLLRAVRVPLKDSGAAINALIEAEDIEAREQANEKARATIWYIRKGSTKVCRNSHVNHVSHVSHVCHTDLFRESSCDETNRTNETNGQTGQNETNTPAVEEVKEKNPPPPKPKAATATEKTEPQRVFGLSIHYYLDLGRGQLPTVKALMQDQKWPQDKAVMAIGMLEQQGYSRGFNCPD